MLYGYKSSEASDSGECSQTECVSPIVFSDPASGSGVAFPLYIRLYSDVPGAVIHYTIDGTEPDSLSETYTEPILLASSGVVLRAIAHVEDCEPGPVASAQFSNSLFPFVFSYACDTPDNAGQWDDFTSNGTNDHHWRLVFTLAGATTIKRLELFQLDAAGNWTTGQAWSTDSPINPFANPATDFGVFPLLVFVAAVQQWAAYQTSLGSFGAATHTWDLYGDVVVPASGLFRLDIILADDTRLSQTISTTCVAVAPPLCPPPATPSAVAGCGQVSLTFSGTVGRDYRIWYSTVTCGTGSWSIIDSGTIDVSPKTVAITPLIPGCLYNFYVSIDESGCGYRDSAIVTSGVSPGALVHISTDKTLVDPDEEFTISWSSSDIGGAVCGGCADGQVSINHLGCKTGNVPGSEVDSQSVCGVYTYEITGCNLCLTHVASVQVEVRCGATCTPPVPNFVTLGIPGALCDSIAADCSVSNRCGPTLVVWDGRMYNDGADGCFYSGGADIGLCLTFPAGTVCGINRAGAGCLFVPQIPVSNSYWELTVSAGAGFDYTEIWIGRKTVGNGPAGTYTRISGCATSPSTLTVS